MNPLTPYLIWFKLGGVALILSAVFFGGCHAQKGREEAKRAKLNHQITILKADRNTLSAALDEVNAKADQAKRDAKAQADNAVAAVRQADKDRAKYETKIDSVEEALERAKRAPVCRAQLEAQLCASLD